MHPLVEQLAQRLIRLRVEIDDEQANNVTAQLLFHESEDASKPVHLHIECEGGHATAALAIYDTLRSLKCPVHTRASKVVGGMALLLLAAGSTGNRVITRGTRVQWVELSSNVTSRSAAQDDELRRLRAVLVAEFASLTGQRPEEISRLMTESRTMTTDAAVGFGLVDLISE